MPWVVRFDPAFMEYCLGDERRHVIIKVHVIDDEVQGEIYHPRVDVKMKGNVRFRWLEFFGNIIGDGPCKTTIG